MISTYRLEIAQAARALSELLIQGGRVEPIDLPVVLAAHASVLDLAEQVHLDLVSSAWTGDWNDLRTLEVHPVLMMRRQIHNHIRVRDSAMSDVLSLPRESVAGSLWQSAAVSSTVALSHWQRNQSLPRGAAAWTELADIAAIAEAAALLDHDVADSLATAGRMRETANFRRAAVAGLRISSHEVGLLASSGPMMVKEPFDMTAGAALPVQRAADLPDAFRRFSALLRGTEGVTPVQAEFMLRTVAEASLLAASSLDGDAVGLAKALREHSNRLAKSFGPIRRVSSLHWGDREAVQQASLIHLWLENRARSQVPFTADEARRLAEVIPPATWQLISVTNEQTHNAGWLFEVGGRWQVSTQSDEAKRLATRLKSVVLTSAEVDLELMKLPPKPELLKTPRVILADALSVGRVLNRPKSPGIPARLDAARYRPRWRS